MRKRFLTIMMAMALVMIISSSAFACAACFGMAAFVDLDLSNNIYDSFITCSIAAAAVLVSLGTANLAQAGAKKKKAANFKSNPEPTVPDVKDTLKYTFAANELKNVDIVELKYRFAEEDYAKYGNGDKLSVEISAVYNGDGNFTDKDECFFSIMKSFSDAINVLFSNENITLISLKEEIKLGDVLENGVTVTVSKKNFGNNYLTVQSTALIDPYGNLLDKAESFYVNPELNVRKAKKQQ